MRKRCYSPHDTHSLFAFESLYEFIGTQLRCSASHEKRPAGAQPNVNLACDVYITPKPVFNEFANTDLCRARHSSQGLVQLKNLFALNRFCIAREGLFACYYRLRSVISTEHHLRIDRAISAPLLPGRSRCRELHSNQCRRMLREDGNAGRGHCLLPRSFLCTVCCTAI